jgi:hypothetical protein
MRSRGFTLMAFVFAAMAGAVWYFQFGPGRPDGTSARFLTVDNAWPELLRVVRPFLQDMTGMLSDMGMPSPVATFLVVAGVLAAGYVIAILVLRLATGMFTAGSMVPGLLQYIVAPVWQVGLTLVSALQTVEWLKSNNLIEGDAMTPAFILYAIFSLVMMRGMAQAREAHA